MFIPIEIFHVPRCETQTTIYILYIEEGSDSIPGSKSETEEWKRVVRYPECNIASTHENLLSSSRHFYLEQLLFDLI